MQKIICYVSIQGLHPSKDPAFAVFESESFRKTSKTLSTFVKWDGLAFSAFAGCVTSCCPYPYITIFATHTHESDNLRHAMLPLLFFISSFSGVQNILGYGRPRRIVAVHPPETGERRPHLWGAFGGAFEIRTAFMWCCDIIGLQMWPPKDADPELRHSTRVPGVLSSIYIQLFSSLSFFREQALGVV